MNKQLPKTSGADILLTRKKNSEKPWGAGCLLLLVRPRDNYDLIALETKARFCSASYNLTAHQALTIFKLYCFFFAYFRFGDGIPPQAKLSLNCWNGNKIL